MGERALRCEMVASSYVCQPNHNYADFVFRLHSDPTSVLVVADVLHYVWCELRNTLWYYSEASATVFTQNHVLVQHLSGIYYVL